jgi:hypothetical protein
MASGNGEGSLVELVVSAAGTATFVQRLGAKPISLGRAPTSDVVVPSADASWHHALFWVDAGKIWVRDLGSSNGTFVNGRRVSGAETVGNGDVVRLGSQLEVQVRGTPAAEPPRGWLVEDLRSGVSIPITGPRFLIGSDRMSDLRLDAGPGRAATLLVHDDGQVWLGTDEDERAIAPGEDFEVAGRQLRLNPSATARPPTAVPAHQLYPYAMSVNAEGPSARVEHTRTGAAYVADSGHRAVLLFLLGKQHHDDRAAGKAAELVGWCEDDAIQSGIWGKKKDSNKYHVLLHRVRAELKDSGFDPWFIEKRAGQVRVRLAVVDVVA